MARKKYEYEKLLQKRAMSLVRKRNETNKWSFKNWGVEYKKLTKKYEEEIKKFKNSGVAFTLKNVNTINREETYNRFHKFFYTPGKLKSLFGEHTIINPLYNKEDYSVEINGKIINVSKKDRKVSLYVALEMFREGKASFELISEKIKLIRESDTDYLSQTYGGQNNKGEDTSNRK